MDIFDYAVKVNDLTDIQAFWLHCVFFFFLTEVSMVGFIVTGLVESQKYINEALSQTGWGNAPP